MAKKGEMVDYISSPRPLFHEKDEEDKRGKETIVLGGVSGGIIIRVSRKGLEFNGYYAGINEPKKYLNLLKFGLIKWTDLEKIKSGAYKRKKAKAKPDSIDKPSEKYLRSLPIVTLNDKQYYIDVDKSERRPVSDPSKVFNFKGLASKEAI